MKKIIFFVNLLFLILANSISAQWGNMRSTDLHAGITGGLTFSGGTFEEGNLKREQSVFSRVGFTGGIFTYYNVSEDVGVKTEILYSTKGFSIPVDQNGKSIEKNLSLSEVSIPVALHINLFSAWSIGLGYQYGLITEIKGDAPFGPEYSEVTSGIFVVFSFLSGGYPAIPLSEIKFTLTSDNISGMPWQTIEISTVTWQLNFEI